MTIVNIIIDDYDDDDNVKTMVKVLLIIMTIKVYGHEDDDKNA